jgi:hypothetical protein
VATRRLWAMSSGAGVAGPPIAEQHEILGVRALDPGTHDRAAREGDAERHLRRRLAMRPNEPPCETNHGRRTRIVARVPLNPPGSSSNRGRPGAVAGEEKGPQSRCTWARSTPKRRACPRGVGAPQRAARRRRGERRHERLHERYGVLSASADWAAGEGLTEGVLVPAGAGFARRWRWIPDGPLDYGRQPPALPCSDVAPSPFIADLPQAPLGRRHRATTRGVESIPEAPMLSSRDFTCSSPSTVALSSRPVDRKEQTHLMDLRTAADTNEGRPLDRDRAA